MVSITISRGEGVAIAFTITDTNNSLLGKRVTWSLADTPLAYTGAPPAAPAAVLKKASGLGASSADVTIATQTAGQITGTINMKVADYAALPKTQYVASLWVDDNAGNDRCIAPTNADGSAASGPWVVNIVAASPR